MLSPFHYLIVHLGFIYKKQNFGCTPGQSHQCIHLIQLKKSVIVSIGNKQSLNVITVGLNSIFWPAHAHNNSRRGLFVHKFFFIYIRL